MDNPSVRRSKRARGLVEEKGCRPWLLPGYPPDPSPVGEAFPEVKAPPRKANARTPRALFEATAEALRAASAGDARGYLEHRGYGTP